MQIMLNPLTYVCQNIAMHELHMVDKLWIFQYAVYLLAKSSLPYLYLVMLFVYVFLYLPFFGE